MPQPDYEDDLVFPPQERLMYCVTHGFDWNENGVRLYEILDRVSCWCCANKNLKELKNYYKFLPEYWEKLKRLQVRDDGTPVEPKDIPTEFLIGKIKVEVLDD